MPDVKLRYTLGPGFEATATAPAPAPQGGPAPAVPTKADVAVTLAAVDEKAWTATVQIPAYDLAAFNKLMEIRVYLLPSGAARPINADGYVSSSYPVEVADVSTVQGGADAAIPLPAVAPSKHLGQIVLGFES